MASVLPCGAATSPPSSKTVAVLTSTSRLALGVCLDALKLQQHILDVPLDERALSGRDVDDQGGVALDWRWLTRCSPPSTR